MCQNWVRGGKKPTKLKKQKQSENNVIKNIRDLFKLKKENKAIKDRIIREEIMALFEQQEEHHYKLERVRIFRIIITSNIKQVVKKKKTY